MKFYTLGLVIILMSCGQQSIDLNHMHKCEATLIQDTDDALVLYAKNTEACGTSNIIALQKFSYRDQNGIAFFKTIDTVSVIIKPNQILTTTYCDDWTEQYIILGSDPRAENFGTILKAWAVNKERTKIIKSKPENIDCINEDFIE